MSCIIPPVSRTCTEIPDVPPDQGRRMDQGLGTEQNREVSGPLESFRPVPAYVLLGDPGAGKSTSFESECEEFGEDVQLIEARNFRTLDLNSRPEWRGKTLFIDGLDEIRAGSRDARTPLDEIRGRLDALGKPRFRLSCREADWLGANDRTKLAAVSPDGSVTVLRLDPLTETDVLRILAGHLGIDDAAKFVAEARAREVDGLLVNPQSLKLLARVVARGGTWPESRMETFERACAQMAQEHNDAHKAAARSTAGMMAVGGPWNQKDLLHVAGRLCAIQILAGGAGYSLTPSDDCDDFPTLDTCDRERDAPDAGRHRDERRPALFRGALATMLFSARSESRFSPVHRHVAEFLAARFLARIIDGPRRTGRETGRGLPARRILALIAGEDGSVVTEFRGLSAWLAAHSGIARNELIERDPIGVGLYGDVSRFSNEEKHALLASLKREASRLYPVSRTAAAFESIATPAMEPVLREILTDSSREKEHQLFAGFVMGILRQGSILPGLAEVLLEIVRDDTWRPNVRTTALDALLHNSPNDSEKTSQLKTLLADIRAGRVADPDDQLLGTLLAQLHPDALSPSEVWEYLSIPANQILLGRCYWFWQNVTDRCSEAQVAEHLDTLAAQFEAVRHVLQHLWWEDLPLKLLSRGLEAHGDRLETKRLYDWLGVGLVSRASEPSGASDAVRHIRSWLEQHGELQKAVFAEGLQRCVETGGDSFESLASEVWRRLYGATLPPDFGLWCLNQSVAATDRRIARFLLLRSMGAVIERANDDGLSLEVLIERTRGHPILERVWSEVSVCPIDAAHANRLERTRDRQHRQDEREQSHRKWLDYVRSHEDALRANRCAPQLLHQIAQAYFGRVFGVEGSDPPARLRNLFRNDDALIKAALAGLRGAVHRDDLPNVEGIVQVPYLALPFLAGLAELERMAPSQPYQLTDRQMRTALAFHYRGVRSGESAWYGQILASHPEVVADMLVQTAEPEIRNRREHVSGLYELACSEDHADVARIASLPLLHAFPIRCAVRQIPDLKYLLWSALQHAGRDSFTSLIECKLSRASMNVAQRACWLAAGLVMSPETCLRLVEEFAASGERRIRHLAAFFDDRDDRAFPIDRLEAPALQLLVRLMGSSFGPPPPPTGEVTKVTFERSVPRRVGKMIHRLAESPTEDAGAALEALSSEAALSRWREALLWARDHQRVLRRDAAFRHPDIEQVCRTLNDGPPANAADLAALVVDRLDEIALRIRTGNTGDWRQFWNEDSHGRPRAPKHEESCRDALLSDLRDRLPQGVDAQPEGQYANDTRADIRIACGSFHIPVEIKKSMHRDLWSAARNQLIAKYTRDPATDGCGVYLVFWFGDIGCQRTPPPPSGTRPADAAELKARLEKMLSPADARKVSVCVIDVRAPDQVNASVR